MDLSSEFISTDLADRTFTSDEAISEHWPIRDT
jgi:hypothetical protein